MEKYKLLFFGLILLSSVVTAQNHQVDLQIMDVSQLNMAALGFVNGLENSTRVMNVVITPQGEEVYAKGSVDWKKIGSSQYNNIVEFTTEMFTSGTYSNTDFGKESVIRIKTSSSNSDLLDDTRKIGKLSGEYQVSVTIYSPDGKPLASDTEIISLINPTQTFEITSPTSGSYWDLGSVIVNWQEVPSNVDSPVSYSIIGVERKATSSSLEDAISQSNQIISGNVGGERTVSLQDPRILKREILPGTEMVVQVTAHIDGPSGGTELKSQIINFFINSLTDDFKEAAVNQLKQVFIQLGGDVDQAFIDMLSDPQADIQTILGDDGKPLSQSEIQELINYIQMNPGKIINARQID